MKFNLIPGLRRANPVRTHLATQRLVLLRATFSAVAFVGLLGCSVAPKQEEAKPLAPAIEPIGDALARAQALELAAGGREQARQIYRDAAKAYPADKRPWVRLAQSFFDARDYGNAVLAAEEVVQRDASDTTAQGLLVISGLRISTSALATLRGPGHLNSSTRDEAEGMAQSLRSILGESVLVPRTAESDADKSAAPKVATKPRIKPRATASPAIPTVPKPATSSNPFGALN